MPRKPSSPVAFPHSADAPRVRYHFPALWDRWNCFNTQVATS
jgi:hypothetical protein